MSKFDKTIYQLEEIDDFQYDSHITQKMKKALKKEERHRREERYKTHNKKNILEEINKERNIKLINEREKKDKLLDIYNY